MKFWIMSLCAGALGLSAFGLRGDATAADVSCRAGDCSDECDVRVECTPRGTCVITCTSPDGEVCTREIECDEPCESASAPADTASCAPASCSSRASCATR